MSDLTGRRRYRAQRRWFREPLLVLQVEINEMVMLGGWPERATLWRDATVQDLLHISASHKPFPIAESEAATSFEIEEDA